MTGIPKQKSYFNSITLAKVADGMPASSLIIETEYDEILRFTKQDGTFEFTPDNFSFRVLDLSSGNYKPDFGWAIGYLDPIEGFVDIVTQSDLTGSPYEYCISSVRNNVGLEPGYNVVYINTLSFYETISADPTLSTLKEQMDKGNAILKIVYPGTVNPQAIKYLNVKYGISADMAQLNISANAITQIVQNTECRFSESGLQVYNGGLIITALSYEQAEENEVTNTNYSDYYVFDGNNKYTAAVEYIENGTYFKKIETDVFSYDENAKALNIVGQGIFTGDIYAENGTFSGYVEAEEGYIGGFSISEGKLTSVTNPNVVLDGQTGYIKADKIFLGESARVYGNLSFANEDQAIPSFILYNPDLGVGYTEEKGSVVLKTAQVTLTNRGYLNLGTLELFGGTGKNDGYMRSVNVDANGQAQNGWWRINENGTSYFDSIYANNAHIQNSILEIETVQSVGSTMVFSEAWTIEKNHTYFEVENEDKTEKTKHWGFVLDKVGSVTANDFVMINDVIHRVKAVLNINEPDESFVYKESLVETEQQFKETNFYIQDGDTYKKATSFVEGTQYYFRVPGGVYTLISVYDFGIGGSGVKVFDFYQPGTVIMRIGAGVSSSKRSYIQAKEKEPIIGRFYYTYDTSSKTYKRYDGISFDENTTYYYVAVGQSDDCIISIEGSQPKETVGELSGVSEFSVPQALSFSSFCNMAGSSDDRPQLAYTKHLILGKLSNSGIDDLEGIKGYGLYADNVYLNGSLTTKSLESMKYAGINTIGEYPFTKSSIVYTDERDQDTSAIVFWGGAASKSKGDVQNASFQVSQNGTVYANAAIFENSVFTKGTISSAKIETAEIVGNGTSANKPALIIKDANANKGIAFYKGSTEVFSIGSDGLEKSGEVFINTSDSTLRFYGKFYSRTDEYLHMIDERGCYFERRPQSGQESKFVIGRFYGDYESTGDNGGTGTLNFDIECSRDSKKEGYHVLQLWKDKVKLNRDTYFSDDTYYGDNGSNGYAMQQRKAMENSKVIGYDIFIY